jgi:sialidase-1
MDSKSGRLLLVYQSYAANVHEFGKMATGYENPAATRCWIQHSDDNGATWSEPCDITRMMKRETEVTTLASGPGIGIQLQSGSNAGRLLIPFNQGPPGKWKVYTAYSDDGGQTWTRGETAPEGPRPGHANELLTNANEVQIAEISSGRALLNCRRQAKGDNRRLQAISEDGGQTWSPLRLVPELIDGPCMASIIRVDKTLLFSGPFQTKRADGVLFHSQDDGATWTRGAQINSGPFAYSVLTRLSDGSIGCLYETGAKGPYERIEFQVISLEHGLGK